MTARLFQVGDSVVIEARRPHPVLGMVGFASESGRPAVVTAAIFSNPVVMPEIGVNESGHRYALRFTDNRGGTIEYVDEEHLRAAPSGDLNTK